MLSNRYGESSSAQLPPITFTWTKLDTCDSLKHITCHVRHESSFNCFIICVAPLQTTPINESVIVGRLG